MICFYFSVSWNVDFDQHLTLDNFILKNELSSENSLPLLNQLMFTSGCIKSLIIVHSKRELLQLFTAIFVI